MLRFWLLRLWRQIAHVIPLFFALLFLDQIVVAKLSDPGWRFALHLLLSLALGALLAATLFRALQNQIESEERFRQLAQNAHSIFWVWDARRQRTEYLNASFERITGHPPEALMGKPYGWLEFVHPDDVALVKNAVAEELKGHPVSSEYRFIRPDGSIVWVWNRAFPLMDAQGKLDLVFGMADDITALKQAEQHKLELAIEREKVKMWETIMRDTSHDLRAPLTAIRTSVYLLERQSGLLIDEISARCHRAAPEVFGRLLEIARSMQDSIRRLDSSSQRLERMIDSLLDMIRLDYPGSYHFQPGDLNHVVGIAVQLHRETANEKSIDLRFEPDPLIQSIALDQAEMCHAVEQILENAIRHTPEGGSVSVRTFAGAAEAIVEIADSGPGIDPAALPRIFEHFYRDDPARATDRGGMGLGLPIARKIALAHGGDISAQSAPGQGSTFRIRLPIRPTELKSTTSPQA